MDDLKNVDEPYSLDLVWTDKFFRENASFLLKFLLNDESVQFSLECSFHGPRWHEHLGISCSRKFQQHKLAHKIYYVLYVVR
jgi:hypothetical protein